MTPRTGALFSMAFLLCAPLSTQAGDYDGSKTLLCVPTDSLTCGGAGECERVTTEELEIPQFISVDFGKKSLSGKLEDGTVRTTPVRHVEKLDGSTLLQGGEYGRGWSIVIQHDTGEMSGAIAGDEGAVVVLGACTVK